MNALNTVTHAAAQSETFTVAGLIAATGLAASEVMKAVRWLSGLRVNYDRKCKAYRWIPGQRNFYQGATK